MPTQGIPNPVRQISLNMPGASASAATALPQGPQRQPARPLVWTFQAVIAVANVPQVVPGLILAPNQSAWVYGKNGAVAGNAKPVFVAERAVLLQGAPNAHCMTVMPGDALPYPVGNTGAVWIAGSTVGDGILIQVLSNPVAGS
jgi:hypothetical protein